MFFGGGGGGFPGFPGFDSDDMPRGRGGPKKDVDNKRFYELLGIAKDASSIEIKKAYHKKALTDHPDKGGDPDIFKEITHAYEILRDEEKRKMYDKYGEDALKEGGGGAHAGGMGDIFDMFMGGGGRR